MLLRRTRVFLRERNALYSRTSSLPHDFYRCCRDYFKIISHVPTYIGQRDSQVRGLFLSSERPFIEESEKNPIEENRPNGVDTSTLSYKKNRSHRSDVTTSRTKGGTASVSSSSTSCITLPRAVEPNEAIFTIPLETIYTTSNIASKPNMLPHLTVKQVENFIRVEGFKLLAPQLYLGVQFAALTSAIPEVPVMQKRSLPSSSSFYLSHDEGSGAYSTEEDKSDARVSLHRYRDLQQSHANPWARVLEDEDFNENFVLHMYGGALDKWQRESFDDLTTTFHRTITSIYEGLGLQKLMKVEHLRRISRLVLARVEHVPPETYYSTPRWQRRLSRAWRRLRHKREPFQLAMIPLLDLVNHSNRPNCGVRIGPSAHLQGKAGITLYSLTRILPGQELCRHYNFSLTRPVALFRYGFLPFDLISIVDLDPANEYIFKNQHQMRPPEEAQRLKEEKEQREIARLEAIFQKAKNSGKGGASTSSVQSVTR